MRLSFVVVASSLIVGCGAAPAERTPAAGGPGAVPVAEPEPERPEGRGAGTDLNAPLLEGLEAHHHEVSTDDPLVQRLFDQGLMLHYGFNHAEAVRSFREAARRDPSCAMCFAGVALSLGPNINAPMDPESVEPAWQAIEQARAQAEHASPRHRRYIEALAARYAEEPPEDRTPLDEAYAEAMPSRKTGGPCTACSRASARRAIASRPARCRSASSGRGSTRTWCSPPPACERRQRPPSRRSGDQGDRRSARYRRPLG